MHCTSQQAQNTGSGELFGRRMLPFPLVQWTGGGRDNLIETIRGEAALGNLQLLKTLRIIAEEDLIDLITTQV